MREHFDTSPAAIPFLLRYQEPGPAPVQITGRYDPVTQSWAHPADLPSLASTRTTTRFTSRSTTRSTSQSTTRSTYRMNSSDTDWDSNPDSDFDNHSDTDYDTAWD